MKRLVSNSVETKIALSQSTSKQYLSCYDDWEQANDRLETAIIQLINERDMYFNDLSKSLEDSSRLDKLTITLNLNIRQLIDSFLRKR